MVRVFFTLIYFLVSASVLVGQNASLNASVISRVQFQGNNSDVWGYQKDSINYAIIGNARQTSVYSLEDPTNPILRYEANGELSIWRDIKSYNNHLYVTTDQGQDGLVIIDMTKAPDTISHTNFRPEIIVNNQTNVLNRCHNLYIDEKGICYLAGCNVGRKGVLMFDLNGDPNNPEYVGIADQTYSHDAFTRGDTLYASEINVGRLTIYDVTDKANPIVLGTQATSRNFTHNAWPSDDGKYVFTTDERGGAYVDAYDIRELPNIKLIDRFRPLERENDNVIPHNTHYYKGFLVTSWYTDGVRIVDAHKPDNLVEIAYYDTWEDPTACHNGFSGCWGAFPFTGTNLLYASDINNGLFVIDVDYKRACYLEGVVKDTDGLAIPNAKIEILSEQINREFTSPSGDYKTGLAFDGSFQVEITHPDFVTQIVTVILERGEVTILNPVLFRKRPIDVSFDIKSVDGEGIPANILLTNNSKPYNLQAGLDGTLNEILSSANYELFVNAWGYERIYQQEFIIGVGADNELVLNLEKGYTDNFENNLNWTVESTPDMAGEWERVRPRGTKFGTIQANPELDSDDDGNIAYVTGNGIPGAGCDDVDNGTTALVSPLMDLSDFNEPKLNYDVWFFNSGGASPVNDTLVIKLTNGIDEVIVDKIFGNTNGWKSVREIDILSFISTEDSLRLIVEASDFSGSGHLVEAGFDNFFISQKIVSSAADLASIYDKVIVYPNPANDQLIIELGEKRNIEVLNYQIISATGSVAKEGAINFHTSRLDINELPVGMYFLDIKGKSPVKFIKQ